MDIVVKNVGNGENARVHDRITRVIQNWGLGGTYLDTSHLKRFDHTTNSACFGGWKKKYCGSLALIGKY